MHIFSNPNFNFVKWRWHAIALSWVIIIAGLLVIWTKGMPKGVEFSGGTIAILKFAQQPDIEQVRNAVSKGVPDGGNAIIQRYGDPGQNQVMIRAHSAGA